MRLPFLVLWSLSVLSADQALRAKLHEQSRTGHSVIPYSSGSRFDTADALGQLDASPADTKVVVLVYSGFTLPVAAFGVSTGWNREHVWPNSYGLDDMEPAFSDLHNLRACDATVNSARGNKLFDFSSASDGNLKDPAHLEAPECTADTDSWQPPLDQRGDIARALFYMDVRYEGTSGEPNLELTEDPSAVRSDRARMGRLSTLLLWNEQDPPDNAERARDAAVARLQGNHNPFVANPGLANDLYLPRAYPTLVSDGTVVFTLAPDPLVSRLTVEYSRNPAGPWSAVQPTNDVTALFVRVALR